MSDLPVLHLKAHRDEAPLRGHLWIFSRALRQPVPALAPGSLVDVHSMDDQFVARGYYHPETDIAVRILTRDPAEKIDADFFRRRVQHALALRDPLLADPFTNAYRLINAEGDLLPGAIVDNYADVLVMQISTAGMERLLPDLVAALDDAVHPKGILLRNDVSVRQREGLEREPPRLLQGEAAPTIEIMEHGTRFLVDAWGGQKTGFFLDQRDKRQALRLFAPGKTVLNAFSYTGAFGVIAAQAGASRITSVDQSGPVMAQAREHFILNGLDPDPHEFLAGDAFARLEGWVAEGRRFDIVILDPPAFAKTFQARPQAMRAYRRLNGLGLEVLEPGGLLVTSSCSGPISWEDFEGSLIEAAQRTGRTLQSIEIFRHGMDHPVLLAMPESSYLKAYFCRA